MYYGEKQLAEKTRSGQETAVKKHYLPWCKKHGLDPIIRTNDPNRGGRCASLLVDLVMTLAYSTSTTYLWYVRDWMMQPAQGGQMDPLEGVYNWDSWIVGVEVETWVPSEPRQQVPFSVLIATVNIADPENMNDVVTVVVLLVLWFTCSRSEFPLTKTKMKFDIRKHCRIRDVKFGPQGSSWMMGTIKQDRKGARPGMSLQPGDSVARKECLVGRVDGIMDLHRWVGLYIELRKKAGTWKYQEACGLDGGDGNGIRSEWDEFVDSPFFVNADGFCFTYEVALDHWRSMMVRAGVETPDIYAFHGLRVDAYNAGRETEDPSLIVETGDWGKLGHARYGRKQESKVLEFANEMVKVATHQRSAVFANSQKMISVAGNAISTGGLPPLPVQALMNARKSVTVEQSIESQTLDEEVVTTSSKGLPEGCVRYEHSLRTGKPYYKYRAPGVSKLFISLRALLTHTTSLTSSAQAADCLIPQMPRSAPGSSKEHASVVPSVVTTPSLAIVVAPRRLSAVSQRASTPSISKSPRLSRNSAGKKRLDKQLNTSHGWDVAR